MTPPVFIRNFSLGSSHLGLGEGDLGLSEAPREEFVHALREQNAAAEGSRSRAIDQFLVDPTLRYRAPTVTAFRAYDEAQLESFVPRLLGQARGGHRLSYYHLFQLHYGLLDRASPQQIPDLSQRVAGIALEYAEFLRNQPDMPDEERMRSLFAGARVLNTYLAHLLRPPSGSLDFPERFSTLNLLFTTLDSLDAELEGYHRNLQRRGLEDIADYEGVRRLIALRRTLRDGRPEAQRQAALDLAGELANHPPAPEDEDWRARAEQVFLETPEALERLRDFDQASPAEQRSAALNALALEMLEVAAATLDQANEVPETVVSNRYRDLGLVLSIAILRHPERTLDELLAQLREPNHQADFSQEISEARTAYPPLAQPLEEALEGREIQALVAAAREAARHVEGLRSGLGRQVLSAILEENSNAHPVRKVAQALEGLPALALQLHLPQAGAIDVQVQRRQAVELLRRGADARAEVRSFEETHPETSTSRLLHALENSNELDGFAGETLHRMNLHLNRANDPEAAALQALTTVLDRETEIAPGLRLSTATQRRARALREQIESWEFRAGRVASHLTSTSSLLGVAAGILATEFLPTLLIARAGVSGSLALGRVALVTEGALAPTGAILTGLGTGLGISLVGSGLHQWERSRLGLQTHWGRDFGSSLLINSATFGLTLPFSRWLTRRLTPRFDATTPFSPLSAGRRLLLHGANVTVGGGIAFGLGYTSRGLASGQWQFSAEEAAENFGSILLWELGAAGLRGARRARGYGGELGAYRRAEVERLTSRLLEVHPGLESRRASIQGHLAREEARYPGWIGRFGALLERGHAPILEGTGRAERLLLLPPESLPLRAVAEEASPRVILVRGNIERPALTEGEAPRPDSTPPPALEAAAEGETAAATSRPSSQPPLAMGESPFYLAVEADSANGEPAGILHLGIPEGAVTGDQHWVLGREHFHFLSPEARRVISRAHLEIRSGDNGLLSIRDLSSPPPPRLPLAEDHGTFWRSPQDRRWHRVPSDGYISFTEIEALAVGNRAEPIVLGLRTDPPPVVLESLRLDGVVAPISTPLRVSLVPKQRQRLNGLILLRTGDNSVFHLMGGGKTQLEITRSLGDRAGQVQRLDASMNPIVGEIGETTKVVVIEEGLRREYRLTLDDPERPAAHLPLIGVEYHGNQRGFRFRSAAPDLVFGKNFQPHLFQAPFISRRHFSLRVVADAGQPRYLLTAEGRFGLFAGRRWLAPNQSILLQAGEAELNFPTQGPQSLLTDGPLLLRLPPIEGVFPEWGTGPLAPGHDRNLPPAPPTPPPLPGVAPPPVQSGWRALLRRYLGL